MKSMSIFLRFRINLKKKTMTDYHDLYLKCDVWLLAGVVENFRNSNLKNYGLYSSHCFSEPTLSWDAMLDMTKVGFELILDAGMYLCFEKYERLSFLYF